MNFSKSINGFSPEEVNKYENDLLRQFEGEKNEVANAVQSSTQELETLKVQKDVLSSNLQSIKESTLFFTSYDKHFSKTLHEAEMEALEKIESIIIEEELFIEKIDDELIKINDTLLILKKDLSAIYGEVENILGKINLRDEVDNHLRELDIFLNKHNHLILSEPVKEESKTEIIPFNPVIPAALPKLSLAKPVEEIKISPVFDYSAQRPKTILIGERDQDTGALLSTILEREGYKTTLVADAYAIINMTKEFEPFGGIIIDSLIPYIEINALIKQIRSSKWCDVPILILSSEKQAANSVTLLNNGANDYIEKPFNPRELIARVNRIHLTPPGSCMIKGG